MAKFCRQCGRELKEDERFCPSCGTSKGRWCCACWNLQPLFLPQSCWMGMIRHLTAQ
ncbi:MAG: zinc-ribbon domain-containing protein [Selenomonas sp.]|nr:zinc-ribbon domain-containing protein [Selenomonas sp.]